MRLPTSDTTTTDLLSTCSASAKTSLVIALVAASSALWACQKDVPEAPPEPPKHELDETLDCPAQTTPDRKQEDGVVELFCVDANGQQHGPWLQRSEQGVIRRRGTYENGKQSGLWTVYDEQGATHLQGQLVDGRRQGEWTYYHINGNKRSTSTYVDGTRQGPFSAWYFDAAPMAIGQYDDDLEQGEWQIFDVKGQLEKRCQMAAGKQLGCEQVKAP